MRTYLLLIVPLLVITGLIISALLRVNHQERPQPTIGAVHSIEHLQFPCRNLDVAGSVNGDLLFSPLWIYAEDGYVYVIDYGADEPILRFDDQFRLLNTFGRWGQGPSEVQTPVAIVGKCDSLLFVHVYPQKRINASNVLDGSYVFSLDADLTTMWREVRYNDGFWVVTRNLPNEPVILCRSDSCGSVATGTELYLSPVESIPERVLRNPYLRDGRIAITSDGTIYVSSLWASLLMAFDNKVTVLFDQYDPLNSQFPPVHAGPPWVNEFPETNISITVDDRYVYTLYSGTIIDEQEFLRENIDVGLNKGEIINVFDKHTGAYITSLRLPLLAKDFAISGDAIFVISDYPEVVLVKFNKPMY